MFLVRPFIAGIAVSVAMLLPYLPGRYDSLAAAFSLMAQVIGSFGLILVPIGAIWMILDRRRLGSERTVNARVALGGMVLVLLMMAIAAFAESGFALATTVLVVGLLVVLRSWRSSTVARYLLVVPIVAAVVMWVFVPRAIGWSRDRAIASAAPLIADIERYRDAKGHYPISLFAVQPDYLPGPVGVREYRYELAGESYNIAFEHPAWAFGTREFVMYNPRDEHALASHAMVLVQRPGDPVYRRGWYAAHDLKQPHWKLFWFD